MALVNGGFLREHCAVAELARQDGAAIEVRGLFKSYGDVQAVSGIDLTVEHGQIFALLGPNGAGKTTTVEILEGYRSRGGGTVKVLGYDPGRQRQRLKSQIGIVLQSTGVDRYLTVVETVAMYAGFYPHPRPVDEVIDLVGLAAKRDTRVLKRSRGRPCHDHRPGGPCRQHVGRGVALRVPLSLPSPKTTHPDGYHRLATARTQYRAN
jgi:ABC-type glutathione transport system ATPase component